VVLTRRETASSSTATSGKANTAKVKEVTKKGKQKWCVGDLPADERCSPAVLDFLRSTHVGRAAPPVEENWDSEGEAEETEVAEVEEQAE